MNVAGRADGYRSRHRFWQQLLIDVAEEVRPGEC